MSKEETTFSKVQTSALINRPVGDVWEFVSDFNNAPKWNFVPEIEQTSKGPLGLGTTFRHRTRLMGKQLVYEDRITEWEPNKKVTAYSERNFRKKPAYVQITLEPVDGKTQMTIVTAYASPNGLSPWRLLMPILAWTFKRQGLEGKVKRILESQAVSSSP